MNTSNENHLLSFEEYLRDFNSDKFLSWIQRQINNREDAEDIYQVVMMRAHKNFSKYRGEANFSNWIYSIAKNALTDEFRKQSRRSKVLTDDDVESLKDREIPDVDTPTTAEHLLQSQDIVKLIQKTMHTLTPAQKKVVELHLQGVGRKEAVEKGFVNTVNTYSAHLSRAKEKMGERLKLLEIPKEDYL